MASTEAHRYDLTRGIAEREAPTMMSAHGRDSSGLYGERIEPDTITWLLAKTQPAALTGGRDAGRFGYEKLRQHYTEIHRDPKLQAGLGIRHDIRHGIYTVATAVHSAVALIKSRPSAHANIEALPTPTREQEAAAVWIETIAVVPEAVGRGIGSALLHDALGRYPEDAQVICQVLGPYEGNPVGEWLEDKLGFELEGQSTQIMWEDTVGSSLYLAESVRSVRAALEESGKFSAIPRTAAA